MRTRPVEVTLDATEWQFLVTTLRGTTSMLKALAALRDALPDGFQLPITTEMIVNTASLTEKIEGQLTLAR
jgi:hypothetical protein